MTRYAPLALLLPLCLAATGDADAIIRQDIQNATGNCQAALPAFDGLIRKRPLAIGNEGTAPAFVTCSLIGDYIAADDTTLLQAVVRNRSAVERTIQCTMVAGLEYDAAPATLYVPKSAVLAPGSEGLFTWTTADNDDAPISGPVNLSCMLPPGTVINLTLRAYDEDVGT